MINERQLFFIVVVLLCFVKAFRTNMESLVLKKKKSLTNKGEEGHAERVSRYKHLTAKTITKDFPETTPLHKGHHNFIQKKKKEYFCEDTCPATTCPNLD